jgi:VCBS repeat-containing protein
LNFNGTDTVDYSVTDGSLTDTGTLTITVTPVVDVTTVTLTASAGTVAEGSTITYTASVDNPVTGTPLVITLSGGTTITIPVGSSSASSAAVVVRVDDVYAQGTTTVVKAITGTSGGNFEALTTTSTVSTTVTEDADATTLSISGSASVTEGAAGSYTLTLTSAATTAVTVNLSYNGTAANGTDYTGITTVTIPAGSSSANFNIATLDDLLAEALENLTVTIASATGGGFENLVISGTNNTVTTAITDNDPTPSLAINDVTVNEAAGTATFTVTLSAASGQTVAVGYNTSNGTATAGTDYTSATGTLTFAPGQTTRTITVPITNDTMRETIESFFVNLINPTNATVSDAVGVGMITDNDPIPTISTITSATMVEGVSIVHTVTLSNPSSVVTTYNYTLGGGTATGGGTDYTTPPTFSNGVTLSGGVLTVPAGVTSFTVTVPTTDDTIDEGASENYSLTVGGVTAVGTITDNDAPPTLTVSDVSVNEGTGSNYAVFAVNLSAASSMAITTSLALANVTAIGGSGTGNTIDYQNNNIEVSHDNGVTWAGGTSITFSAGDTDALVRVLIRANSSTDAASETFTLTATTTAGTTANVSDIGTATIIEDSRDIERRSDNDATEGGDIVMQYDIAAGATASYSYSVYGTASATDLGAPVFTVTRSSGAGPHSVTLSGGLLTITGGVTRFSVTYPTINDTLDEPIETVIVNIGGALTSATITDDDNAPSISINDVTVNEAAGTATFTVTLSTASGQTVAVDYDSTSGTAVIGGDFTATSGTVTFAPGVTTQTITVPINNDAVYEGAETFKVNLSSPINATISDSQGVGTIMDNGTGVGGTDNDTPSFSVSSVTVSDDAAGFATFVVSLSNASSVATVFSLALANGTATGGGTDYGAAGATNLQVSTNNGATWVNATTATIAPSDTYVLVRTPITADVLNEVGETFTLTATRTSGVTSNASAVGNATITDVNNAPVAVNDVPVSTLQEDGGTAATTILAGNAILGGSGSMPDSDPTNDTLTITGAVAGTGAVVGAVTLTSPLVVRGIYGDLQISADGSYTYTLDNSRIQTQNLINGQVANDVFTYKITDGNGGFDSATITVAITGTLDLTAITPQPEAIIADGLMGEYYGYNDTAITGNRVHADDGTATSLGTSSNLESVEDIEKIINGRNVAMGGPDNVVGTANAGVTDAADVRFAVRTLNYGTTPVVSGDLGGNSAQAAGSILAPQDDVAGSTTNALANFLDQDASTAVVQAGTPTGGAVGTQTGLGKTTDAIVRMTGYVYLERGNYDFRVTADDGFRLKVGGETLLEFDGNQAPTTRTFNNVEVSDLISGLTSIELLYWEQGGNANLQFEFKPSSSSTWVPFSLDSIAFFSTNSVPTLTDTRIQDIVETSVNQQYELRTGSVLDGDANTNTLTGAAGRDYIQGFGGADILIGNGAADFLDGGDGDDNLDGGDGNDILVGGAGADTMTGGTGDDIYRIDSAGDVVIEAAGEGTDTIEIESTYNPGVYTIAANFENVLLNGSANTNVTGNTLDNRITGNDGNNVLDGGAGSDRLIGGKGNDTLIGGTGSDIFEWNLADKGAPGAPAIDTITGFVYNATKVDSLDLRDLLAGEASTELNTGSTPNIGNLLDYLNIQVSGADTVINVSSTGGFTGGTYSAGAEDQRIVLTNVNLFTATGTGNEGALIQEMLKNGSLIVD